MTGQRMCVSGGEHNGSSRTGILQERARVQARQSGLSGLCRWVAFSRAAKRQQRQRGQLGTAARACGCACGRGRVCEDAWQSLLVDWPPAKDKALGLRESEARAIVGAAPPCAGHTAGTGHGRRRCNANAQWSQAAVFLGCQLET